MVKKLVIGLATTNEYLKRQQGSMSEELTELVLGIGTEISIVPVRSGRCSQPLSGRRPRCRGSLSYAKPPQSRLCSAATVRSTTLSAGEAGILVTLKEVSQQESYRDLVIIYKLQDAMVAATCLQGPTSPSRG